MLKWIKTRIKLWVLLSALGEGSVRENSDRVDKIRSIGKPAVKPLIRALNTGDLQVKLECIRALGHLHDMRAIPALESLLDHREEIVRQQADIAIQAIRSFIKEGRRQ